jgi:hypothetical protein
MFKDSILTDEDILKIMELYPVNTNQWDEHIVFARAIEEFLKEKLQETSKGLSL